MSPRRWCNFGWAAAFLITMLLAGCHEASPPEASESTAPPLDAPMAAARAKGLPLAILVIDPNRGAADDAAKVAFRSATMSSGNTAITTVLDLSASRNRAAAAPFHALDVPTLVCLSPGGVVISRDEKSITPDLVRLRIAQATQQGPSLDHRVAELSAAADAKPTDVNRQMALADFLLAHQTDQQAIPHLEQVAHDESADLAVRVRAWVALGRAHLWLVEPEKARHAAQALMATLGPQSPEAMAGGNLVRGLQDTKAKRYDRAREELEAAVAAAPTSAYGREAKGLLAKLPGGGK